MPTTVLPTSVIVHRVEPMRDRHYTPQFNEELPVVESVQTAPKPVDYTSFYGVGRDPVRAWPRRRLYQALAIQDKLSIMAPNFLFPKVPSALVAGYGAGSYGMNPIQERSNIASQPHTTYGALSAVAPGPSWGPQYAKLV